MIKTEEVGLGCAIDPKYNIQVYIIFDSFIYSLEELNSLMKGNVLVTFNNESSRFSDCEDADLT